MCTCQLLGRSRAQTFLFDPVTHLSLPTTSVRIRFSLVECLCVFIVFVLVGVGVCSSSSLGSLISLVQSAQTTPGGVLSPPPPSPDFTFVNFVTFSTSCQLNSILSFSDAKFENIFRI